MIIRLLTQMVEIVLLCAVIEWRLTNISFEKAFFKKIHWLNAVVFVVCTNVLHLGLLLSLVAAFVAMTLYKNKFGIS